MPPRNVKPYFPFSRNTLPSYAEMEEIANSQEVIDATERIMAELPDDGSFESFEALKQRRDEIGIVRKDKFASRNR